MANRMYEDAGLDLDEIIGSEVEELLKHAGQLYNISGLVFQGNEKTFVVMFPNASELDHEIDSSDLYHPSGTDQWVVLNVDDLMFPSIAELQAIIKRTDSPLIFEKDETGVLKAIIRKSQRVISGAVQQQIWCRDNFMCMYCGKSAPEIQITIDHFIPLEKGGEDKPSNYLTACRSCGKMKGNQNPEDFCNDHGYDYSGLKSYIEGKASFDFVFHLMTKEKIWRKRE